MIEGALVGIVEGSVGLGAVKGGAGERCGKRVTGEGGVGLGGASQMLLAFSEQTAGKKFQWDASDQKMLEIEMTSLPSPDLGFANPK
ncbi:hypothetical protein ACS0TY_024470 [Phlomoides rotata]